MSFLSEIRIFFRNLTDWFLLLAIFTVFFLTFNIENTVLLGRHVLLPVPSQPSFAAEFFTILASDLAPNAVPLIVVSPMTAFVTLVKISFLLAIVFTFPVFLYRLTSYLAPALYQHEMRLIYRLIFPLTLLFFFGAYFAYRFLIPSTLSILYGFVEPLGVTAMLGTAEFMGVVMALILMTGVSFTLPVFMVVLTALGAVRTSWWLANSRYAIVSFLIVSAIITPDGSGVSMILLTAPVSLLYGAGILVCHRVEKVGSRDKDNLNELLSSINH